MTKITNEIDDNNAALKHLIVTHSKYDLAWLLSLDIVEFYRHIKLIERDIHEQRNSNKNPL